MKADKFSESLNQIDDKYIEEAASYQAAGQAPVYQMPPSPPKNTNRGMKVWRVIAIVACSLLVVGLGIGVIAAVSDSGGSSQSASFREETAGAGTYDAGDTGDSYLATEDVYKGADVPMQEGEGIYPQDAGVTEKNGVTSNGASLTTPVPSNPDAKIIYTASLTVQTTEFDDAQNKIAEITKKHKGYFENMDISNDSSSYRSAYYQIRIPVDELDAFLEESDSFGAIVSANRNADDVSESYYDTQSRLDSAKAKLSRLQELYAQAQDMSDIITIENEISNVQWEIDNLTGQLKHYDSQVSYSTVSINLKEVYKTSTEIAPLSFGERISQAFKNGMENVGEVFEEILIWIAANWIWLIIILAVIAAAIIIPIKVEQKSRKKKEAALEKKDEA